MSSKRAREIDLQIKAADGELLQAEACIIRACSYVARELPAKTSQWDVSGLLLDGQPFNRKTVKCWLGCACSLLHGPAELDTEDKQQLSTAKELHQLLAFARAVGSTEMLLTAACSQLVSLQFVVDVQDKQARLPLRFGLHDTDQGAYWFGTVNELLPVRWESPQQEQEAKQQVAAQASELLHMAHTLRLQPLLNTLHNFLFGAGSDWGGVLYGMLDQVFTEAVLDAALGNSNISKETYINSVLTRPAALSKQRHFGGFLEPTGRFKCDEESGQLQFEAKLLQNFAKGKAGEGVHVTLGLFSQDGSDLPPHLCLQFESDMWMVEEMGEEPPKVYYPAQLLLGTSISSANDLYYAMRSKLRG